MCRLTRTAGWAIIPLVFCVYKISLIGFRAYRVFIKLLTNEIAMYPKQISVFLENKKGGLAEVTQLLAQEHINIRALSLADLPDVGVLRMIVNDWQQCLHLLRSQDFVVQETDVIAVEIDDKPGGLHRIVEVLSRENINVEYMYTFLTKRVQTAIVVFKTDAAGEAVEALRRNGISIILEDKIPNL